jgi:hypothetical protein
MMAQRLTRNGLRDLNDFKGRRWSASEEPVVTRRPPAMEDELPRSRHRPLPVYDVIHADSARGVVLARFPGAHIEDATDMVHEGRFTVELPKDFSWKEWYEWLLISGYAAASITFLLELYNRDFRQWAASRTKVLRPETPRAV